MRSTEPAGLSVNLACLGRPATDGGPLGPGLRAHPALAVLIPLAVAAAPGVPGHALSGRRGRRDCGQPGRYRGHPGQPAQPGPSDHGSTAAGIGTLAGMLVGAGIGGGGVVGERWHSELARWAAVGRGGPNHNQKGRHRASQARSANPNATSTMTRRPEVHDSPGWAAAPADSTAQQPSGTDQAHFMRGPRAMRGACRLPAHRLPRQAPVVRAQSAADRVAGHRFSAGQHLA
jgi:hypothetical protein